ncbi:MAG: DUF4363 family protein [Clostridia bacterium]
MRKAVLLILILAIIVSAGVSEHYFIHRTFDSFNLQLQEIDSLIDKNKSSEALEKVRILQKWWDKKRKIIDGISFSPDSRQVNVVIGEIEGSLDTDDMQNAESKIDSLFELIKNIRDILDFDFADIF